MKWCVYGIEAHGILLLKNEKKEAREGEIRHFIWKWRRRKKEKARKRGRWRLLFWACVRRECLDRRVRRGRGRVKS